MKSVIIRSHFFHSKVPAFLNVVDIAGLVAGAHEGKGLGNAFLSNIQACDAIFHVIREYELSDSLVAKKITGLCGCVAIQDTNQAL